MTRPDWPRVRVRLFTAATLTCSAALSFDSTRHLATYFGFGQLAYAFPLTLDAVAAVSMDYWVNRTVAMRQARTLALVAIGLSLVANAMDHWLSQGSIAAAVMGAVPPAMLAALLSLIHRNSAGPQDGPVAEPVAVPDGPFLRITSETDRLTLPWSVAFPPFIGPLAEGQPGPFDELADGPGLNMLDRPDRTMRIVPDQADRPAPARRKRTASVVRTVGHRTTAKVPTDREIVSWIADQTDRVTKAAVMARYSVGSGRALRLMKEATDA